MKYNLWEEIKLASRLLLWVAIPFELVKVCNGESRNLIASFVLIALCLVAQYLTYSKKG